MSPDGSVTDALARAAAMAASGDRIVVFGSFHTVGPALEYLCRSAGVRRWIGTLRIILPHGRLP